MLRVATRGSQLARWQADQVVAALGVPAEVVTISTTGDRQAEVPVWEMSGTAVFVKEVSGAVIEGRADLAVHSAKDLPSATWPGLALAAITRRGDPRDALVGATLESLAPGATVATGSVRRRAQLAWSRPDLTFTGLRGAIPTRLDRVPRGGAVVVAHAALQRLGLADEAAQVLDASVVLPQVGQGALAVECRAGDEAVLELVGPIEDWASRQAVDAERSFLASLGGGCDLPVAAWARPEGHEDAPDGQRHFRLDGLVASLDGRVLLRRSLVGDDPVALGAALAAQLLDQCGGRELLAGSRGSLVSGLRGASQGPVAR